MTKVLIIDDEESYRETLAFLFTREGFEVTVAADGGSRLAAFERAGADIVLLDLMMPGMSGTEVCRQLRLRSSVPIIMLTARDAEIDKVVGLELGADDYVTKPFSHRELIARIRAVLRRGQEVEDYVQVVEAGGVRMDTDRHELTVRGKQVQLALKEFELLEILLRNTGRVLTRGQLIDRVWGPDYVGDTKTLDVHIKRLRGKIEVDPANPVLLVTVRGLGYKFNSQSSRGCRTGQCYCRRRLSLADVTDITVFSGHAHPEFAEQMCELLGVELSPSRLSRFSNDCLQVQLRANCRQRDVYIVQPLVPPTQENLMELLMMVDAARGASAAQVTVVMPHYAYARSDKKDAPRISIGGRLVADLIHTAGADRVLTMALHAQQVHGFFSMPVDQLTALPVLATHFRNRDLSNTVIVSPDFGNAKEANQFARMLGVGMAAGSKRRQADDRVVIDAIVGEVTGRDVIILDDEIATAGSVVELIDTVRGYGVNSISVACTHGLFTGKARERLNGVSDITEIVTTNTVPATTGLDKLTTVSVAPLFAEAVRRINCGESVSGLFSDEVTYG